jgi:(3,5-dihydroxyphenyl)acetyl-CoA 1,2-dioxygenase
MLPRSEIEQYERSAPAHTGDFDADRAAFGAFWSRAVALRAKLPAKAQRNADEAGAAQAIVSAARASRVRFMRAHASSVYAALTARRTQFARIDDLCLRASVEFPGLVPSVAELEAESGSILRDKEGLEIDQGLFFSHVLAHEPSGMHLCHAMLLPRSDSEERFAEFDRTGELDLPGVNLKRSGKASILTIRNPRFLNAEDETTIPGLETAVDLALLDPKTEVCVLRGGIVENPKHAGRRLFGAGINLTHLYQGKIRYLWYLIRDFGLVNKFYRGLAKPDVSPEEDSIEKMWIAVVEGFAIGGHCQKLLTMDYVLAAQDAYMTLPARKEGIIPGAANLRLTRHVGARIARQAVLAELRIACDSAEGRLICDTIVPPASMDAEVQRLVDLLTSSGMVSAAGNRRAFRAEEEPLDAFRRYMAIYSREQAHCHFSPALIRNLEANWNAANRRG